MYKNGSGSYITPSQIPFEIDIYEPSSKYEAWRIFIPNLRSIEHNVQKRQENWIINISRAKSRVSAGM